MAKKRNNPEYSSFHPIVALTPANARFAIKLEHCYRYFTGVVFYAPGDRPALTGHIPKMSSIMPRRYPTDPATDAADASEERMREALGLGKRSESVAHPQQNHTPHTSDPNRVRRRFAQDGDVPVVVLGRSREAEAAQELRVAALETKLQEERAARQTAERTVESCQATIQSLRTKLAHSEMAIDEARAAERQARAEAAAAIERQTQVQTTQAQPESEPVSQAELVAEEPQSRLVREPRKAKVVADSNEPEPQPIEWWLPSFRAQTRGRGRPRKT